MEGTGAGLSDWPGCCAHTGPCLLPRSQEGGRHTLDVVSPYRKEHVSLNMWQAEFFLAMCFAWRRTKS